MLRGSSLASIARPQLRALTYEAIKQAILDLQLPPGSQLKEQELARQLDVSRTPVHDALVRLEQEGFVEGEAFRGYVVATLQPGDVAEIFELRKVLEGHCARKAARQLNTQEFERLRNITQAAEEAVTQGDNAMCHQLFTEFDDVLFAHLENRRMQALLGGLRDQVVMLGSMTTALPGRASASCEEHRRIVAALERRDPEAAASAMSDHIDSLKASLLQALNEQQP